MAEAPAAAAPEQATPNSLREAVASRDLANLTGPLGSGKSRLVAGLGPVSLVDLDRPGALERLPTALAEDTPAPLVVDSADDDRALAALEPLRLRGRAAAGPSSWSADAPCWPGRDGPTRGSRSWRPSRGRTRGSGV